MENPYEWMFRQLPVYASAIDDEGRFLEVSDALGERLGYQRGELIGLGPLQIATDDSRRLIEQEYRPILRRTGRLDNAPIEFRDADGNVVPLTVRTRIAPVDEAGLQRWAVSVYRDADAGLEALRDDFVRMYRATPAMLHTIDRDGRVLEVSDRWLRKLGYEREEVIGRVILDFLTESTQEKLTSGALELLFSAEEHTNHPREMRTRDGGIIEVLMSAVAEHDAAGEPVRLLVASKDVTEMNRAERQLRETLEENSRLRSRLEKERDYLREEVAVSMNFGHIVGSSEALQRMLQRIEAVAETPASVLILGESGTGKELVAHAIHTSSPRAGRPLVKVNCAAISDELFESEFFGHVKGAFTGAVRDRVGRFELADGGTLFLDEVGEIPLELQGKLLRVLQEREFERVGDDHTRSVDVRVVAASNRDLAAEVAAGRFREDLYYRLSVFPVEVPPLRARGDDVVQIAQHLLEQIAADFGVDTPGLTESQVAALRQYDWPGNVRELNNTLERAVILAGDGPLRIEIGGRDAFPHDLADQPARGGNRPHILNEEQIRELQRDNMVAALEAADWRVSGAGGAAELLGLRPTTLADRIKSFDIERPHRTG